MLLTETIQKSITAIKLRRNATDNKAKAEAYYNALTNLNQTAKTIEKTLRCAIELQSQGIISEPLLSEELKTNLLSGIDRCGSGVSPDSEEQLTMETVKLLQSKGDAITAAINVAWTAAADDYAKGPVGYLSLIGNLTDDPKQASDIVNSIAQTVNGAPSIKAISKLTDDVASAKNITKDFSSSPEVQNFLRKVSSRQATVADLTPDVTAWLQDKCLMDKLKVRF